MIKWMCLLLCFMAPALMKSQEDVSLSTGAFFEGEPYLKTNPENPNHLVVAWMGFVNAAQNIKIKVRASFDAGVTWSTITNLAHVQTGFTSADPSIAFNLNGDVLIAYIDWTGSDGDPLAGGIQMSRSTDGGLSFNTPQEVLNINEMPAQKIIDRPWITVDRSSTSTAGNIYITSMNAKEAAPEYHPFISTSTDGGNSFTFSTLDGANWRSGDLITAPMPTPAVQGNGVFYAVYPSFVFSQNTMAQYIIASSSDGGTTFNYQTVFASNETFSNNDPLPKKGYLLREDPSDINHLAFFYPSNINEDLDIYFMETLDAGETWSVSSRINDDPLANDRMQDLVWADFNNQGDLIVTWRDRRNASESGYETASEIWAAYRPNGSDTFQPNFQITDQTVAYNALLAQAGNDFMSVQLVEQLVHTTWGDTRTGTLKIWYQRSETDGSVLSTVNLAQSNLALIFPNPALDIVTVQPDDWTSLSIYSLDGKQINEIQNAPATTNQTINISHLSKGVYIFEVTTATGVTSQKVIKK
jgi:hypothetical protein